MLLVVLGLTLVIVGFLLRAEGPADRTPSVPVTEPTPQTIKPKGRPMVRTAKKSPFDTATPKLVGAKTTTTSTRD